MFHPWFMERFIMLARWSFYLACRVSTEYSYMDGGCGTIVVDKMMGELGHSSDSNRYLTRIHVRPAARAQ